MRLRTVEEGCAPLVILGNSDDISVFFPHVFQKNSFLLYFTILWSFFSKIKVLELFILMFVHTCEWRSSPGFVGV